MARFHDTFLGLREIVPNAFQVRFPSFPNSILDLNLIHVKNVNVLDICPSAKIDAFLSRPEAAVLRTYRISTVADVACAPVHDLALVHFE
jgi:hypothetical protein